VHADAEPATIDFNALAMHDRTHATRMPTRPNPLAITNYHSNVVTGFEFEPFADPYQRPISCPQIVAANAIGASARFIEASSAAEAPAPTAEHDMSCKLNGP
jgi:hypothetical protein